MLLVEVPSKFSSVQKSTILKLLSGKSEDEYLIEFLSYLKIISENPYIKKVFFIIDKIEYGLAEVDAICQAIDGLNKCGKETIAFSESGDLKTLYLLSFFEKRFTFEPGEFLSILPSSESFFFGKLAKKAGVEVESFASGAYKSFGENFSRDKYSKEARSNIEELISSLKDLILNRFLSSTSLTEKDLQKPILTSRFLFDKKFFNGYSDSEEFSENYFLENFPECEKDSKKYVRSSSTSQIYFHHNKKEFAWLPKRKKAIVVLPLKGTILEGEYDENEMKADSIHARPLVKILREIKSDKNIAGLILELDTGGGSAYASEIIHRELEKLKKEKKVYSYFQNISASGGYYISTASEKIYSSKFCITGSIGTIVMRPNLKGLYEKLGITKDRIGFYELREIFSEYGKLGETSKKVIQSEIDRINSQFYKRVCDSRKITVSQLEKLAQGRVFTGHDFLGHGMIDSVSSIMEAVIDMKNELKLDRVNIHYEPASYSLKSFFRDVKFMSSRLKHLETIEKLLFHNGSLSKSYLSDVALKIGKYL